MKILQLQVLLVLFLFYQSCNTFTFNRTTANSDVPEGVEIQHSNGINTDDQPEPNTQFGKLYTESRGNPRSKKNNRIIELSKFQIPPKLVTPNVQLYVTVVLKDLRHKTHKTPLDIRPVQREHAVINSIDKDYELDKDQSAINLFPTKDEMEKLLAKNPKRRNVKGNGKQKHCSNRGGNNNCH